MIYNIGVRALDIYPPEGKSWTIAVRAVHTAVLNTSTSPVILDNKDGVE